jgi:hypothetical protein
VFDRLTSNSSIRLLAQWNALAARSRARSPQQLRQLGDADRDLSRLFLSHEIRCGATAWLRLELDMRRSKVVSVADYLAVAR